MFRFRSANRINGIQRAKNISENEGDVCVVCGRQTEIPRSVPVDFRLCYVDGIGQLCLSCWKRLNGIDPK